jgi:hypothetical protein
MHPSAQASSLRFENGYSDFRYSIGARLSVRRQMELEVALAVIDHRAEIAKPTIVAGAALHPGEQTWRAQGSV